MPKKNGLSTILPFHLYEISHIVTRNKDWKVAMDQIFVLLRSFFIFDNLVVYLLNATSIQLDAIFARSVGRGKTAEADTAWGEEIANRILETQQYIIEEPAQLSLDNRLKNPYFIGLPISIGNKILGVIVFIRFGGPPFSNDDFNLVEFISNQVTVLLARKQLEEVQEALESKKKEVLLQENFVSTISHELRSPLGFIKGYTTTLLREDTQWDQDTQREFLQIIDKETDNLQNLIENLLDSARLQSGQLDFYFQMIKLDSILSDVIARTTMHHPTKIIRLNPTNNLQSVRGDPTRLAQVFSNLIDNAIKYAPESDIIISIDQIDKHSFISFQDFGQGIPEHQQDLIFQRFYRSPTQTQNIHGSGLGLYICREIINAHCGRLWVESIPKQGSTFKIEIPTTGLA